MEPEGSLPHSQQLSTCPCPEPYQSNPHYPILFLQDPSWYYSPTYILFFLAVAFPPITYMHASSPHSCYMPRPSHLPRLHYSNYTWRRVQIMKLFIMQYSLFSCHIISLRSKYLPQHSVLKHPHSMFLPNVRHKAWQPYRTTGKVIVLNIKKYSVTSVRKRTIPAERPSLVSEVSANF
jgi:hypothetical protein